MPLSLIWVYPRTHGETSTFSIAATIVSGLSPYTRGNPLSPACRFHPTGSIPVHTGKPMASLNIGLLEEVYPRTHGETKTLNNISFGTQGLSPYTRGNLLLSRCTHPLVWSIPVHTGKPSRGRLRQNQPKVYPRTHGETHEIQLQEGEG